jgi:hypothetical protein
VDAKIIVALGNRFPMIRAHKVLAAYGCLVPRLLSGEFDAQRHRAVWPSTGNYCRGGVAISRILGCRSIAVLPEGMSTERFDWLDEWVDDPSDILRTPGTESNVKEIYDACHRLSQDPDNIIFNQFAEFGNYIVHRAVTGPALARIFDTVNDGNLRARAYVSASGSGGTLAAGDHLKQKYGSDICVVEAVECPTLLYNGYGEHNIQGIGDKHIPLIHNAQEHGFLIERTKGSFGQKTRAGQGRATEWEITTEACDGQPAKALYRSWKKQNAVPEAGTASTYGRNRSGINAAPDHPNGTCSRNRSTRLQDRSGS